MMAKLKYLLLKLTRYNDSAKRKNRELKQMNIFVLDTDPQKAVQALCDKHVVKMTLETAQILCNAHRLRNNYFIKERPTLDEKLYKLTHANHPCTRWTHTSLENYQWLVRYFRYILEEYKFRYNKTHKCARLLLFFEEHNLINVGYSYEYRIKKRVQFVKVTDNDLEDVVLSYRQYYRNKGETMVMTWKNRNKPEFL